LFSFLAFCQAGVMLGQRLINREVRAVWDEENSKWRFSILDIVSVLTDQDNYIKTRNYWKYLNAKPKKIITLAVKLN
jgi:hypothetical protein